MERATATVAASRLPGGSSKVRKEVAVAQVSVVEGVVGTAVSLDTGLRSAEKPSETVSSAARRLTLCRLKTRTMRC